MIRSVLIANRGEIACRIAVTARRMGLRTVAVYSDADANARHVRMADEAQHIGPAPPRQSYLDIDRVIGAARAARVEAIHPGYGFLSENPSFAAACADAGIAFVGPPVAAMAAMSSKAAAKLAMAAAGVPVLPGYHGDEQDTDGLERHARGLGFPLIVKPSAGGGGKGMQIVTAPEQMRSAIATAKRLAASAFGDDRLLLERYLAAPRHVEVQIFADARGQVVHLFERDCSVQRRHQKLIEEAPAPALAGHVREALHAAACRVAAAIGYVGAGTVEFLYADGAFYFMEMNTRLQVEHAVTEAITGIDLVEWQLRVAAGEPLPMAQEDITHRGHALEVRICAEDPQADFAPSAGKLGLVRWPQATRASPAVRVDQGFEAGDTVSTHYDSLLGKIITHAATRTACIDRMIEALGELRISGVATNAAWLAAAIDTTGFRKADISTAFVAARGASPLAYPHIELGAAAAATVWLACRRHADDLSPWSVPDGFRNGAASGAPLVIGCGDRSWSARVMRLAEREYEIILGNIRARTFHDSAVASIHRVLERSTGKRFEVLVDDTTAQVWHGAASVVFDLRQHDDRETMEQARDGSLASPLPGIVVDVRVAEGDVVAAGQPLLVIEAMKMEHTIRAPRAGSVQSLRYRIGDRVREGQALLELAEP